MTSNNKRSIIIIAILIPLITGLEVLLTLSIDENTQKIQDLRDVIYRCEVVNTELHELYTELWLLDYYVASMLENGSMNDAEAYITMFSFIYYKLPLVVDYMREVQAVKYAIFNTSSIYIIHQTFEDVIYNYTWQYEETLSILNYTVQNIYDGNLNIAFTFYFDTPYMRELVESEEFQSVRIIKIFRILLIFSIALLGFIIVVLTKKLDAPIQY